ncbi:MAG: hypothetical protein IPJ27_06205 [Candidatus Accumulibacter sp.]|uniref:Uncharacterized protein n=1 Tax=Candidatus Accumulibacter proximus TaxID=2954385 RepID=A0A935PXU3_9PROT|nr:hypothetical protein [Candidatus Accumulibacter proximus]
MDIWQMAAIARYLDLPFTNPEIKSKVATLLKDAALPNLDRDRQTPGRDTQFELFLASTWTMAGHPCHMMPPPGADFALQLGAYVFGMEAKRIKSLESLAKRSGKAAQQLRSFPAGGLIATDLTVPILGSRQFLTATSGTAAIRDLERRLCLLMRTSLGKVRAAAKGGAAFGWIGYCQSLYMIPGQALICAYQWKNFNLQSGEDPRWLQVVKAFDDLVLTPGRLA